MKVIYILALALVVVCVHVAYANPVPGDVDGVDSDPNGQNEGNSGNRQLGHFYVPPPLDISEGPVYLMGHDGGYRTRFRNLPDEIPEDADLKGGQRRQLRYRKFYDEIPPPDEISEDADLKGGQRRQLRFPKLYDEIPPPEADGLPPPEADGRNLRCGHHCPLNHIIVKHYRAYDAIPPPDTDGGDLRGGHDRNSRYRGVRPCRFCDDEIPPPEADGGDLRDGCNRNTGYRFVKHYRAYEAIPPPEDLNDGGEFDRNPDYRGLTNIIRGIARFVKKL